MILTKSTYFTNLKQSVQKVMCKRKTLHIIFFKNKGTDERESITKKYKANKSTGTHVTKEHDNQYTIDTLIK
jgi:hypothetical protein